MELGHYGAAFSGRLFGWEPQCFSLGTLSRFDSYNQDRMGPLGAVVGFMVWLWISAVIVLLGGELNAEMEHQTARDTTEGRSKPLGSRGAMMADRVGASHD